MRKNLEVRKEIGKEAGVLDSRKKTGLEKSRGRKAFAALCLLLVMVCTGACSGGSSGSGPKRAKQEAAEKISGKAGAEKISGKEAAEESGSKEATEESGGKEAAEEISGKAGAENAAAEERSQEAHRLKVVATLFPYYDFTRQIAGDMVDLELIIPAGMDSHSFEPTPADMRKIQEADVVICNGGAMEHWVSQVLDAMDTSHMTVVTMMDYVDAVEEEIVEGMEENHGHAHEEHGQDEEGREDDDGEGGTARTDTRKPERASVYGRDREDSRNQTDAGRNPADHEPESGSAFTGHAREDHDHETEYDEHIWTSPVNAVTFTKVIAEALAQADPARRQEYEAGRDRYTEELLRLHRGFQEMARDRKRNLVVVGDKFPFRYLAEEYGLDYRAAFTGCSTDTEPSARTIAYLIDQVRQEQLPAVYYLELSSHRVTEIIGEETGASPLLLHSCHNVTRREFEGGVTYIELMEQNIENLRKGLVE